MPFSLAFTGDVHDTLGSFLSRLERFVTVKGDEIARQRPPDARRGHLARSRPRTAGRACRPRSAPAPTSCRKPRPPRPPAPPPPRPPATTPPTTAATTDHDRRTGASSDERDHRHLARALRRRKLWPVALLLVGALVAVPMVLAKAPEPPPADPAAERQRRTSRSRPRFVAPPRTRRRRRPSAAACWATRRTRSSPKALPKAKKKQGRSRGRRRRPRTRPRPTEQGRSGDDREAGGAGGGTVPPVAPGADADPAPRSRVLDQGPLRHDRDRASWRPRPSSAWPCSRTRRPRC